MTELIKLFNEMKILIVAPLNEATTDVILRKLLTLVLIYHMGLSPSPVQLLMQPPAAITPAYTPWERPRALFHVPQQLRSAAAIASSRL
jgi:hypothetical protein